MGGRGIKKVSELDIGFTRLASWPSLYIFIGFQISKTMQSNSYNMLYYKSLTRSIFKFNLTNHII